MLINLLVIVLIYYIGTRFYTLAAQYNRNKWAFAILGILCFHLSSNSLGIIYYILGSPLFSIAGVTSDVLLDFLSIPVGLFLTWLFYNHTQHKLETSTPSPSSREDLLDDNF